ncbi:MAG: hypothetical protein IKE01_03375 [Clostridia bacterium]|nr:hypothetical protein [Clostridia bacterium]
MIYDKSGNIVSFDGILKKLILSQLGHELIHSAARYRDSNGRNSFTGLKNNDITRGINEGFTQMITENIFGYTVSPHSDGYRDLKKTAKILQATFGEKFIVNAYFNHDGSLAKACNITSNNEQFYDELCSLTNQIYYVNKMKNNKAITTSALSLYDSYVDAMYRNVVINIVCPKIRKLPPDKQQEYIKEVLTGLSDDGEVLRKVSNMIKRYSSLDIEGLENEKKVLSKKITTLNQRYKFLVQLTEDKPWRDFLIIDNEGRIHPKINIKSRLAGAAEELAYSKIYMQEHGYSKFDSTGKKIIDDEMLKQLSDYVVGLCEREGKGVTLKCMQNESLVERKASLAAIKTVARLNGYIVLNSINDTNTANETMLQCIKAPTADHPIAFEDLHKVYSKFELNFKENEDGTIVYTACDRATGDKVTDKQIELITRFASLWTTAAGVKRYTRDNFPGETYAFNEDAKKVFLKLGEMISRYMNESRSNGYKSNP